MLNPTATDPPNRESPNSLKGPSPDDLPRVLIVSIDPLSETSNNGKTFASFFHGYPSHKLGQLYFHRTLPRSEACNNYYRISDEDALRLVARKTPHLGGRVNRETKADRFLSPKINSALASSAAVRVIRAAVLQKILAAENDSLSGWLRELRPEVIFFCGGDATQLYPLVLNIAQRFDSRIAFYITDDYILPVIAGGPFAWLRRRLVRRRVLEVCELSSLVLTIGDKMRGVYAEQFGVQSKSIMNLSSDEASLHPRRIRHPKDPLWLSYAGGLHLNRWKVLAKIGASLDRLASEGIVGELHIYSATELDTKMLRSLQKCRSIRLEGRAGRLELLDVYARSDILVHVESFAPRDRVSTRLSVSTKIPEYLASGRTILAVGPGDVASMEYLCSINAALVGTSLHKEPLDALLRRALSDRELRDHLAHTASVVAEQNHNAETIRGQLWQDLVAITRPATFSRSALEHDVAEPQ